MSINQSVGAKARWEDCRRLAEVLECGKIHVHDRLYTRMRKEGLVDAVLNSDETAVALVRSWSEYSEPERELCYKSENGAAATKMDRLKLTMWFIGKVGGIQNARKALDFVERMEAELE